jgi:predicted small integral membrane protein
MRSVVWRFSFSLVSVNNISDYKSNFEFVRHVLSMDTTFPGNHGLWRALPQPSVHIVFFIALVLWLQWARLLSGACSGSSPSSMWEGNGF